MKNNRKKKAFTLTELLVVVIVIGVLSAVVLPKFSKVIATRKTTEAEEMMAAVRTEQEKRCALDKNYTTDAATVNLASLNTKNFNYTLKNTGIEAASTGKYGYTLKMPSYRDGRLCCDSAEQCAKLNKNYPLCSELTAKADYTSGTECAAGGEEPTLPKTCSGSSTQACGCNNGGTQTRTCDTTTGTWSAWSTCSISDTCECTETPEATSQTCNSCGTQTRTATCNTATGKWNYSSWGTCSKTQRECDCQNPPAGEASSQACPDGYSGTQTRTWNASACAWSDWSDTCTDSCQEHYSMPTGTGILASDTCDGDAKNMFYCDDNPSFRGTCSDVYSTSSSSSGSGSGTGTGSGTTVLPPTTIPGGTGTITLPTTPSTGTIKGWGSSLKGTKMANGLPAPTFYYTVTIGTGGPDLSTPMEPLDDGPCPDNAHGNCCCGTDACHAKWPGLKLCPGYTPSPSLGGGTFQFTTFVRTVTCCGQ